MRHRHVRYASLLLLLATEVDQAAADGAASLMYFYDKSFQPRLAQAGICRSMSCVLVEKVVAGSVNGAPM